MKKSELTQLTQIIEHLVAREVRKQLPELIAEVFQNGLNKPILESKKQPKQVAPAPIQEDVQPEEFKSSLKELFSGVTRNEAAIVENTQPVAQPKQYTKNAVLNQILNETRGDLGQRERLVGGAAYAGGYSTMPLAGVPDQIPVGRPPTLREGQESNHTPMEAIPQGVSALDVAKAGMVPAPVTEALTNYGRMKAVLDASKKRR